MVRGQSLIITLKMLRVVVGYECSQRVSGSHTVSFLRRYTCDASFWGTGGLYVHAHMHAQVFEGFDAKEQRNILFF